MDRFTYGENVLGRDVAVKFRVGKKGAKNEKTYLGVVRRLQLHLDEENELEMLHQIAYQDGDEEWYDLEELEESGRLAWLNFGNLDEEPTKKPAARRTASLPTKRRHKPSAKKLAQRYASDSDEESDEDDGMAMKTPPPKKRRAAPTADRVGSSNTAKAAMVTPQKPVKREPADDEEDLPAWFFDMYNWMVNVKHGSRHTTVTETNARSVMRQVKKLVRGQGISYKNWEEGIVFYEDEHVDLTFDFEEMLIQARQFEALHGKDKGNGWLMQHPITKLELYKQHRLENDLPLIEEEEKKSEVEAEAEGEGETEGEDEEEPVATEAMEPSEHTAVIPVATTSE